MTNQELYEEIKKLREDFQDFKDGHNKAFYFFKGQAFGFIAVVCAVFTFVSTYITDKIK
jgi:DNA-binding winged helix-turn-helix (wHTH) protein